MGITRYEELDVWKTAHQAVLETYRMTMKYPVEERYGLVSQMRDAARSIAANITEGFGRRRSKDKIRFYNFSQGSIEELRYYYRLSTDLGYLVDASGVGQLLDRTACMLKRLVARTSDLT